MHKPLISILIPCYNIGKLNRFSLNSVLKNKSKDIEILLLNDYSTDDTLSILNAYKELDKRIRVFDLKDYHEKVGIGFNRDFLIRQARGKYFLFIDDDDYMKKNTIKYIIENLNDDFDLMSINYRMKFNLFKNILISLPTVPKRKSVNHNCPRDTYFKNPTFPWAKVIKREYYLNICNKYNAKFDQKIYEDIRFLFFLFLDEPKYKYLSKPLFNYCIRKNSLSTKIINYEQKIDAVYETLDQTIIKIKESNILKDDSEYSLLKFWYTLYFYFIVDGWLKLVNLKEKRRFLIYASQKIILFKEKYPSSDPRDLNLISKIMYKKIKRDIDKNFNKLKNNNKLLNKY
ncbi:glycosyltransferase family 2 protein [Mycoplasmopsis lipofaciens]|uniref:glycosyltransferase family 2 protein n=1 Tax=Mycoplasmopsis lipofaciens TaxID=114884 RepID=UPI00068E183F|nr:glycosyltransferase family 2 protein [Mycoplasmopsis lipofaciens]